MPANEPYEVIEVSVRKVEVEGDAGPHPQGPRTTRRFSGHYTARPTAGGHSVASTERVREPVHEPVWRGEPTQSAEP